MPPTFYPDPANPPLTVKPRQPQFRHLPIIAVAHDGVYWERTGETRGFLHNLDTEPPSLIVTPYPDRFLAHAHDTYKDDPAWNWRVMPAERVIGFDDNAQVRMESLVMYCGWRYGRSDTRYHYPISPIQYGRHSLDDIGSPAAPVFWRLYEWAVQLRNFCQANFVKVSPTGGGIATQLLRDRRFYPRPRRKVPTATNERARPHLPGNHYELRVKEDTLYAAAVIIDQEAAHHHAALSLDLPNADSLYARGNWHSERGEWLDAEDLAGHHGLVKVSAFVPPVAATRRWIPRQLDTSGHRELWLYTNELDFVRSLGVEIYTVIAGWLSDTIDTHLQSYARWALAKRAESPRWLKGTFLTAYGILGAKPRPYRSCYWRAKKGENQQIWLDSKLVDSKLIATDRLQQSPVANTIQRGMIEAETRRRSLTTARYLESEGIRVYAVQADAVIVEGNCQLPLLPHPWRIKERLSWVRFPNSQTVISLGPQKGEPLARISA